MSKLSIPLKRIEALISECLCIFIGCIHTIFISLWPGTQSRIGTSAKGIETQKYENRSCFIKL